MTKALPRSTVIKIGLISEAILLLVALIWLQQRSLPLRIELTSSGCLLGVVLTLPLLALNYFIFRVQAQSPEPNVFREFLEEYIQPLCANLDVWSAALIGVASGVSEEIFFRGALTEELNLHLGIWPATVIASVLFAYVHFVGFARHFWQLLLLYTFFGLAFGVIVLVTNNLVPAMVAHGVYNFVVILYVRGTLAKPK